MPSAQPTFRKIAFAGSSPCSARLKMLFALNSTSLPDASLLNSSAPDAIASLAIRTTPVADANCSTQPELPQLHLGPLGSMVMWPSSPAMPSQTSPRITMPPPTPVPSVTVPPNVTDVAVDVTTSGPSVPSISTESAVPPEPPVTLIAVAPTKLNAGDRLELNVPLPVPVGLMIVVSLLAVPLMVRLSPPASP